MLLLVGAAHCAAARPPHRETKKGQVLMTLTPAQAASYAHWEQRTVNLRLLPDVQPIIPFGGNGLHSGGGDDPNAPTTAAPHLLPFGSSYHTGGDSGEQSFFSGQQGRGSDGADEAPPPPPPPACANWCYGTVRLNHQSAEAKNRTFFPTDDIADWAEKCSWDLHCGGCEQCNKTSTVTCDEFCAVRGTQRVHSPCRHPRAVTSHPPTPRPAHTHSPLTPPSATAFRSHYDRPLAVCHTLALSHAPYHKHRAGPQRRGLGGPLEEGDTAP